MLTGIGDSARVVQERSTDTNWRGEITGSDDGLSTDEVAQQVSMPEMGLASVRLRGSGSAYRLEVKSVTGIVLPKPKILATGDDLVLRFSGLTGASKTRQTSSLDLRRPGRVAQPVMAPPIRPRAVAPPLGDMAVGTMLVNNRSFVTASGPPVSLTLNNAPAKDALMSLARLGGYGFVFVGGADLPTAEGVDSSQYPVTMAFRDERYDRALNSVLMSSGLQGRLDGNTLLVGTAISAKSFGPQMSKVFRMNQVDVESASQYLGNLGAAITVTRTSTAAASEESSDDGESSDSGGSNDPTASVSSSVETYSSGFGPLIGLIGTTDSRLNTITLIGDPKLISVAESYLRQIDLRKRQVAVKVQILNVTLDNDASIDSSFSAKIGNTFIVSQSGKAHMNFGAYKPGGPLLGSGTYNGSEYVNPGTYPSFVPRVQAQDVRDPVIAAKDVKNGIVTPIFDKNGNQIGSDVTYPDLLDEKGRPVYIPDSNPNAAKQLVPRIDKKGRPIYVNARDQNSFKYPDNSFYSYLESVIISSSSKTLSQPTLLVQEGETAVVRSGENVITGVSKNDTANGSTQFTNTREDAGLTVNLEVEKIDDNGFVTMKLNPAISVPTSAGQQEGVQIFNIVKRELNSGRIRLRDRQTLILTGVITESDRQLARKWPILGDLPLIGQLFRSSSSNRQKNELVIIVTPSILDDDNGGTYGYGYRPGTSAGRELVQQGY
uniref:type II secretion system protein GspD n=1 Tax=Synechococcus sp. UW106 TaxID=368495 RepID=UPI001FCC125C|nr:general secretion pathway protein GspD [Synechococcus sp. UW106]